MNKFYSVLLLFLAGCQIPNHFEETGECKEVTSWDKENKKWVKNTTASWNVKWDSIDYNTVVPKEKHSD